MQILKNVLPFQDLFGKAFQPLENQDMRSFFLPPPKRASKAPNWYLPYICPIDACIFWHISTKTFMHQGLLNSFACHKLLFKKFSCLSISQLLNLILCLVLACLDALCLCIHYTYNYKLKSTNNNVQRHFLIFISWKKKKKQFLITLHPTNQPTADGVYQNMRFVL